MIDTILLLTALINVVPVLYAIALFTYSVSFFSEDKLARRLSRPLLIVAVLVNLAYLLIFTVFFEHIPLVTVFQVMGMVGFSVAAIYLWVETRTGTPHTGPFMLSLILVFQAVNAISPKLDRDVPEILVSTLFSVHVSAAVLGYSAFAVAAVYGLLYLIQYKEIRSKRFGLVFRRLPSLDILDRMNFYAASAGFALLTVAIVVGVVWSARVFGEVSPDPKVLVAVLTWAVYGFAISGHLFTSWKGQRMAYSSLLGFFVVLFSIFAVNFFMSKFHVFTS